jgi:hypothetical protein
MGGFKASIHAHKRTVRHQEAHPTEQTSERSNQSTMKTKTSLVMLCHALALGLVITQVDAAEAAANDPPPYFGVYNDPVKPWDLTFTPYVFVPARVDADSTVDGMTTPLNLDMSDTLKLFSGAFAGRFEAYNHERRYGAFVDGSWMRLRGGGDLPTPTPAPLPDSVDVEIQEVYVDFGLSYRFKPVPLSRSDERVALNIEPILGGRYHWMQQDINLNPGPTLGGSRGWAEPFFGARLAVPLGQRWTTAVRGDVGGFGIGSDLTWNLYGGFDYRPWQRVSFKLGYRAYYVDYTDGSGMDKWGFEGILHGPYLGVTFNF